MTTGNAGPVASSGIRIIPSSGSIKGGSQFSILNTTVSTNHLSDDFTDPLLSTSKWVSLSDDLDAYGISGYGGFGDQNSPVSVNDGLYFNAGTGTAVVGIATTNQFNNLDIMVQYSHNIDSQLVYTNATINYLTVNLYIDANNYFKVSKLWDGANLRSIIRVVLAVDGVQSEINVTPIKGSTGLFRIVRYSGRVIVYHGSTLIIDYYGWLSTTCIIQLLTSNGIVVPYNTITTIRSFDVKVLVVFDAQYIAPITTELDTRIVGIIPTGISPESVGVVLYDNVNSQTTINEFTYTPVNQLSIDEQSQVFINNDGSLRL